MSRYTDFLADIMEFRTAAAPSHEIDWAQCKLAKKYPLDTFQATKYKLVSRPRKAAKK